MLLYDTLWITTAFLRIMLFDIGIAIPEGSSVPSSIPEATMLPGTPFTHISLTIQEMMI